MLRVILLLEQMVKSCQNCSHSSIASFFPVSWPSKTGYLASTSAHMMLPLARSRTTLGSSETWGKRKKKFQNQPTGLGCQKKEDSPWTQETTVESVSDRIPPKTGPYSVSNWLPSKPLYLVMLTSLPGWGPALPPAQKPYQLPWVPQFPTEPFLVIPSLQATWSYFICIKFNS